MKRRFKKLVAFFVIFLLLHPDICLLHSKAPHRIQITTLATLYTKELEGAHGLDIGQ